MILLATILCVPLIVTDGDTIVCNDERVRILGLDAPEVNSAKCDAEHRLGVVAKRRLQQLIGDANLEIRRNGKDRYGRTLAWVIADGTDIAEPMISEGFARVCKSAGCRRPWCEEKDEVPFGR